MAKVVKIKQSDIENIVLNIIKENMEPDDYAPDPDSAYEDSTYIDDEPNDVEHQDDNDDISTDAEGEPYWTGDYVNVDGKAYQIVIGGDGRVRLYDKTTDNALSTEESMVMLKQGKRMSSDTEGNNDNEEEFTFS
jgi:hypothetical protein